MGRCYGHIKGERKAPPYKNSSHGPKGRDSKLQKSGVIYRFKCPHINCLEECIGESGRTFGDRLKDHLRASSPIHHQSHSAGPPVNLECFPIVDRGIPGSL